MILDNNIYLKKRLDTLLTPKMRITDYYEYKRRTFSPKVIWSKWNVKNNPLKNVRKFPIGSGLGA